MLTRRNVHIHDEDWEALAELAEERGEPSSVLIREAIRDFIRREGRKRNREKAG